MNFENTTPVKEKKKLLAVIEFNTKNILTEAKESFLYELDEQTQIWLPYKSIWTYKLMYWKFKLPVYENSEFKYTVITKDKKEFQVTAETLLATLEKTENLSNVNILKSKN